MVKYERKTDQIEVTQWFKNGDHPKDNSQELIGNDGSFLSEGKVVRRFRRPNIDGQTKCEECGKSMHIHGWIDNLNHRDFVVCPGDWVITVNNGGRYRSESDSDFRARYRRSPEDY